MANMNSWLAQVNTMAENIKLMSTQLTDKIIRLLLTIGSEAMDDTEDLHEKQTDRSPCHDGSQRP